MGNIGYNELVQDLGNDKIANLYLLMGDEYLVNNLKNKICNIILKKPKNDFNFFLFTDSNVDIDLFDVNVNTFPINSENKCIILQDINFESIENEKIDQFISILGDIPKFSNIIICNCVKNEKNINLYKIKKLVSKFGFVVDLNPKELDLQKQIVFWAEHDFGKKISSAVSKKICDNSKNTGIAELKNKIEKLCRIEKSSTVTFDTLSKLDDKKAKIFDLPKEILNGNVDKAVLLLKELLAQGEDPISIVSVVSLDYIDILRTKLFDKYNIDLNKLKELFVYKSKEFRITNAQKRSSNFSIASIKKSLKLLLAADLKLKTTSLNEEMSILELIIELEKYIKTKNLVEFRH